MVKRLCFGIILLIVICFALICCFYPVDEISGYFTGGDTLYYSVNSDGTVDYYMNYYVHQLMDDGPKNCPHSDNRSIVAKKHLNLIQKLKINSYVKKIKENSMVGNYHSGTDGVIYLCVKIDGVKYYSDPYEMIYRSSINEYSEYELPDVIDLNTFMWYIKPSECDEYWSIDKNAYPLPDMDKDNFKGVLSFFRNHHTRMVEKAEYLNSIAK